MAVNMEHDEAQRLLATFVAGGLEGPELAALRAHVATCDICGNELRALTQLDQEMDMMFAGARPAANLEDRIVRGLWMGGSARSTLKMPRLRVHPAVWKVSMGVAATIVLGTIGYIGNDLITTNRLPLMGVAVQAPGTDDDAGDGKFRSGAAASAVPGNSSAYGMPRFDDFDGDSIAEEAGKDPKVAQGAIRSPQQQGQARVEAVTKRFYEQELGYKERARERNEVGAASGDGFGNGMTWQFGRPGESGSGSGSMAGPGTLTVLTAEAQQKLDGANPADTSGGKPLSRLMGTAPMTIEGVAADYVDISNFTKEFTDKNGISVRGSVQGTVKELAEAERDTAGVAIDAHFKPAAFGGQAGDPSKFAQGRNVNLGAGVAPTDDDKWLKSPQSGEAVAAAKSQNSGGVSGTGSSTAAGASEAATPEAPKPAAPANTQKPGADALVNPSAQNPPATQFARKIIRNGEMEFEVDSFDSAFVTISRVVGEEGGFVSSTNSEKLNNGKVRGTVVVRVPPDRLDVLVLKLRALGDIKSQKISAQDVTKVYYDLESELKAARAMEERLLSIIKSGKGEIKDLLEAEKQLGVYREKIEKVEGEVRYYNNLVSLSTLSITAAERDIRQAAMTAQSETVSMGLESEDVEKSRADALKAIEDAKGRIIESNLKKYDAGQVASTVVAEVSPDAAGPLIDRLRQLGKVARLDIDRRQTTPEGRPPVPGGRVERKDTRFAISIYNLANIAPRQTTNLNLAVTNVEDAYRAILATVTERKGRVVTSNLARQKGGEQTTATIQFEVPSAEADAVLAQLRLEREVMALTVTENPDTQNVTTAKRGFAVQVHSLATVPPRETEQMVLATRGRVSETFRNLLAEARKADARVLVSQLNEQDATNLAASLDIEVLRGKEVDLRQAILGAGDIISRSVNRSSDTDNTVDSKIRLQLRLIGLEKLAPRETQSLNVAAYDVPASYSALAAALAESGARVISSQLNEQDRRNITATLDFEVIRDNREKVDKALADAGVVYARSVTRSPDTHNTVDNKLRLQVTLVNVNQLAPRESTQLSVVVKDVGAASRQVVTTTTAAGGRITESRQAIDNKGRITSQLILDVPLAEAAKVRTALEQLGEVRVNESTTNPATPDGQVARARFEVTLASAELIVGRDEGLGASLRSAIATSVKGLLWSLQFIVIGLLFVGPWALLIWALWRFFRRPRPALATVPTTPAV